MAKVLIGNVKGQQGIPGKSAYDIAVSHGFEGTEEEWLDSISEKELNKNILKMQSGLDSTKKRVTNLERSVYGDLAREVVDDSVAYTKPVPANAKPNARIDAGGGMTRKCTNLIPFPYIWGTSITQSGITLTANADGSIAISGTATDNTWAESAKIPLEATTYTVRLANKPSGYNVYLISPTSDAEDIKLTESAQTFTAVNGTYTLVIQCISGYSFNTVTNIMLNAGTTALPYEPYFEGLRSAPVTEIESVGVNMFGGDAFADKLVEFGGTKNAGAGTVYVRGDTVDDKIAFTNFKPNTQYTFIVKASTETLGGINLCIQYTDGTEYCPRSTTVNTAVVYRAVSESGKTVKSLIGSWQANTTYYYNECGIFEGVLTAEDFKPYVKHTLPIPAEVRAKPWYGHGISKDVCNAIRYNEDGSRSGDVKCGVVDLGTLEWTYRADVFGGSFCAVVPTMKQNTAASECAKYQVVTSGFSNSDKAIYTMNNGNSVFVKDSAYTDAAAFKAAMSGVMLVYELATPTTEDISDILPADNYIGVEGGGTLTFVNEYGYDVPSEVVFVTKEVTE